MLSNNVTIINGMVRTKDDYYSPTDQTIGNYNGYHIVFNGGFIRAQENGFTKIEFPSSMGAGGWSRADVQKMFDKIDARRTGDAEFEEGKHKRDASGKFSSSGGGGAKNKPDEAGERLKAWQREHEAKMNAHEEARRKKLAEKGRKDLWEPFRNEMDRWHKQLGELKKKYKEKGYDPDDFGNDPRKLSDVGKQYWTEHSKLITEHHERADALEPYKKRTTEEKVQQKKKLAEMSKESKDSDSDVVVISSQDMAKYNELKAKGYTTAWTGEGKIAMVPPKTKDAMTINEYQTRVQELRNQAKKARENGDMAEFNKIAKQIEDLTKEYNTKDAYEDELIEKGSYKGCKYEIYYTGSHTFFYVTIWYNNKEYQRKGYSIEEIRAITRYKIDDLLSKGQKNSKMKDEDLKDKLIRLAEQAGDKQYADDVRNGKVPTSNLQERINYYTSGFNKDSKKTKDTDYIEFNKLMQLIKDGRIEVDSWVRVSGSHGTVQVRGTTGKLSSLFVENIPDWFKKKYNLDSKTKDRKTKDASFNPGDNAYWDWGGQVRNVTIIRKDPDNPNHYEVKWRTSIFAVPTGDLYKERPDVKKIWGTDADIFTPGMIEKLRSGYEGINTVDPSQPTYQKLISLLDKMSQSQLKQLADANIKFVSKLAKNRVRDAEKQLSIFREGDKYKLIGAIYEQELENLRKKGFSSYQEALDTIKRFGYSLFNVGDARKTKDQFSEGAKVRITGGRFIGMHATILKTSLTESRVELQNGKVEVIDNQWIEKL